MAGKRRAPPVFWFPVLLAAVAIAVIVFIERSPFAPETREYLKHVVSTGFGLAIAAFLAIAAVLALPWWLGAAVGGSILYANGAWDITKEMIGQQLDPPCPEGQVLSDDGNFCMGIYSPNTNPGG